MKESDFILEAPFDMVGARVAEEVERIHDENASNIKYNDENFLSSVLSLAYLSARKYYFKPVRKLPSGKGFSEIVFIPKSKYIRQYPALLVELKWNKDAGSAIEQIKNRNYPDSIKGYTDNILLVGINYDRKSRKHECVIEKL